MACFFGQMKISSYVLHQRLEHPSAHILSMIIRTKIVFVSSDLDKCVVCAIGKSCKLPFPESHSLSNNLPKLVEMNLWGPAPVKSNGYIYYLSIVDVYCTRFTWIYFLNKKSDMARIFPKFHKLGEKQIGGTLKAIQTDGGGEFKSPASYLLQYGIDHRVTPPYTS